jgi:predicted O-methyltransferase YrrM
MINIRELLNEKGFYDIEGYSQQVEEQVNDLVDIINYVKNQNKSTINIMEIGFNAGHSAQLFLHNQNSILTSFDLGAREYVQSAKSIIDAEYPNRHTLILGDSTKTVPEFIENNPNTKFDIIFIDGGHEYDIAKSDIENCVKLADSNTIVIMDDTVFKKEWRQHYTIGPTAVWTKYVESGKIMDLNRRNYCIGRGMSWGKYNLKNSAPVVFRTLFNSSSSF